MKQLLLWCNLLVLLVIVMACTNTRSLSQTVDVEQGIITYEKSVTDQLGNLYIVNTANEIFKLDPEDRQLGYYSNNQLGNVGLIDATSPLKVLVFYPAFNTGVVLDRRLLETGRFNLIELGFGEINMVTFSRDGTIWIFNDHEQRLYRVNQQGEIVRKGDDLRLIFNERLQPTRMVEVGDYLYVGAPDRGLLIFDLFGQYRSQILQPEIADFQVIEDQSLVFTNSDSLTVIQLRTLEERQYQLPEIVLESKVLLTKQQLIRVTSSDIIRLPLSELIKE